MDYTALKQRKFDDVVHRYDVTDSILYAVAVGLGVDSADLQQLRFVYEEQIQALPTMAVVLGYAGFWMKLPDAGLDWKNILHVDQELVMHRSLSPHGEVIGRTVVEGIEDRGNKGALIYTRCDLYDSRTSELIATTRSGNLCRSDGNFGGGDVIPRIAHSIPERSADAECTLPTSLQSALIYRLCGDDNPLHVDIRVANDAGFERPILHGLCTFGVAGHAVLRSLCEYRPERLKKMRVRFSSPVYPGDTLRTTFWIHGDGIAVFQCHALERDVMVINNGYVEYEHFSEASG